MLKFSFKHRKVKRDTEEKTAFRASLIWWSEPVLTSSQRQTEQAISIGI